MLAKCSSEVRQTGRFACPFENIVYQQLMYKSVNYSISMRNFIRQHISDELPEQTSAQVQPLSRSELTALSDPQSTIPLEDPAGDVHPFVLFFSLPVREHVLKDSNSPS